MRTTLRSAASFCFLLPLLLPLVSHPVAAQAPRPWTDLRTAGPFAFHADFPLGRYEALLHQMTRLQHELNQALRIGISHETIDVYLFSSQETYNQYMQQYFPGIPQRRAMFVKSQSPGNVFAYQNDKLAVDLRHECTHALLHASLPYVPLWLDEGLAEYFEVPQRERANNNPHLKAIRWHLRFRNPGALAELERIRDLPEMGRSEY